MPSEYRKRKLSPRELACSASHLKAVRIAFESGSDIALIVEDDVEFGLLSREWLDELISRMPEDCAVLQLMVVPATAQAELLRFGSETGTPFVRKDSVYSTRFTPGIAKAPTAG